jgi:FKBP-type peptidyl-prolyl cis-trans isomerase SlyD
MKVNNTKVVSIDYTLTDNDGNIIDTSAGREPLTYLHGHGQLIAGMEGKEKGEKFSLKISPEKGYGQRDERLIQQVPLSAFGGQDVQPGMQFEAGSDQQRYIVTITEVGTENVTVDGNHALAGVELNFDVEIKDVREASAEELDHGHVHGPGGHHH